MFPAGDYFGLVGGYLIDASNASSLTAVPTAPAWNTCTQGDEDLEEEEEEEEEQSEEAAAEEMDDEAELEVELELEAELVAEEAESDAADNAAEAAEEEALAELEAEVVEEEEEVGFGRRRRRLLNTSGILRISRSKNGHILTCLQYQQRMSMDATGLLSIGY
jgi:hypothetical protein